MMGERERDWNESMLMGDLSETGIIWLFATMSGWIGGKEIS